MITTEQLNSICMQCGMCCDGTLFNHAKIMDDADEKAVAQLGLTVLKNEDQQSYFPQPCACFKTCCTVYENRPKVCISFFCAPLRKARRGLIDFEKAHDIIQTALALRAEVLALASTIEVFKHFSIRDLFEAMNPQPSDTLKQHPALLIKIAAVKVSLIKMLEPKKAKPE